MRTFDEAIKLLSGVTKELESQTNTGHTILKQKLAMAKLEEFKQGAH